MKKLITLLLILITILIPLTASEGFGFIFDEEVETEEKATSSFDVRGKVSTGLETFIHTTDLSKSDMNPFATLNFSLNYTHPSLGGNAELYLPALQLGEVNFKDIIKELSLSYFIPNGKIQAGYFIHRWGVVDTARVVDVINANDYSSGLSMNQREMKISEPMILTQLYFDRTQLELIYKPIFTPIQMATSGRWKTLPDNVTNIMSNPTTTYSPNTNTLDYGSFGAKLAMPVGPVDTAIMYYRGHYERPAFNITGTLITPTAPFAPYMVYNIESIYTMMNIIGTEVNYVTGPFTFAAEGAFYISEDTDESDAALYNSKFSYIGSISYMIPSTTSYITASYNGTTILGYDESNPLDVDTGSGPEQDHNIIVGVHIPLMKEKLLIEAGLTYQIPTKGYALLSKIDYTLKDDITLSVEGNLFGTFDNSKDSIYKSWADNDSLSISLTYQY